VIWRGPSRIDVLPRTSIPLTLEIVNRGRTIWQASAREDSAVAWFTRLGQLRSLTAWWASVDLPARGLEWPIWGIGGSALWLAAPDSFLGRFALGVRWFRDGRPIASEIFPLSADLFPGGSARLLRAPTGPAVPGEYEIELLVQAPSLLPVAPAPGGAWPRIPVRVRPPGGP
jgi:hypothetical protein